MFGIIKDIIAGVFHQIRLSRYKESLRRKAIKANEIYNIEEKGYVLSLTQNKAKFYLPYFNSELIQQHIISNGTYFEKKALDYIFHEVLNGDVGRYIRNKTVLDIGANIGNHTLYFALECGAGKVYSFEPMDKVYSILEKNVEINSLQNIVELHHVGVGSRTAKAKMRHFEKTNMGATIIDYNESGDIPMVAVDELKIQGDIAFVKVDVEGFEMEVFNGMNKTIEQHKPFIMAEICDENFDKIKSSLSGFGYWYIRLGKGINYLFVPPLSLKLI